jgi:hypothetical protein
MHFPAQCLWMDFRIHKPKPLIVKPVFFVHFFAQCLWMTRMTLRQLGVLPLDGGDGSKVGDPTPYALPIWGVSMSNNRSVLRW